MSESNINTSMVAVTSTALTKAGAKSLLVRGLADLRANEVSKSPADISRNGDEDCDWILLEGKWEPELTYIGGACTSCGKFISIMQMNIECTAPRSILKERLAQLGWTEEEGTCVCGSKTVFQPNTMHIGESVDDALIFLNSMGFPGPAYRSWEIKNLKPKCASLDSLP